MSLFVVIVAAGLSVAGLARSVRHVREEQVRLGLFGERAREGLIGRGVAAVIQAAERDVRLGHFAAALRTKAWEGTPAEILVPRLGHATTWRFPSDVWQVRLSRTMPRWARRVVVRSVELRGPHLLMDVYVPGGPELVIAVEDVRFRSGCRSMTP
ncbi:MAG TPA: hypothetical protein VM143_08505 [Acidimicrobiales bacterium]|nr:hypothetical protein [Acidimicrobiales bacterium]